MAGGIADVLNNRFRLSGMASGLDTDSMVQQLMKVERMKVDRVKQDRQILEWKRDEYRSITNLLRGFKDEFFDVIKSSSNMRSQSNYKIHNATSTSESVTAIASSDAVSGTHTITDIKLAKAAYSSSTAGVTKAVESSAAIADFNFAAGKDFNISLNGISRKVTIQGDYSNADPAVAVANLAQAMQTAVNTTFGDGRINVTADTVAGKIRLDSPDSRITVTSGTLDALGQLKITSGSTNRLNLSTKLSALNTGTELTGTLDFKINGERFTFDTTKYTMNDVINSINSNAKANVTLNYSEVTDKFTLTSKVMGAGTAISVENLGGNLFGASSAINITNTTVDNGTDAEFKLDSTTEVIRRNSNIFSIDGVTYTLRDTASATITVSQDNNAVYDKIKAFIDKYNEVIGTIDIELSEEHSREYLPLTDEQKESMNEDDVKKWEEKAKSGMLKNDGILSGIKYNFRKAIFDTINGMKETLNSIGITTGTYQEKGRLIIDEQKLREAIKSSPDKVMNLFAKESALEYDPNASASQRSQRYNENGIVNRLYDILQDNIRTTRDSNNKKGVLLEKAGMIGDITEFDSLIPDEIEDKDDRIKELTSKLYDKEDNYYRKFAAMESALSKMNSQSAWLTQQLGGGQQ